MKESQLALPKNYTQVLESIKKQVHEARYKSFRAVNKELIELYWNIGKTVSIRTKKKEWGRRTVAKLAEDLRVEFQGVSGFFKR